MQDAMVVTVTERKPTSSVKQEEEEALTTGRMDYSLPDFHLLHCKANKMPWLSFLPL